MKGRRADQAFRTTRASAATGFEPAMMTGLRSISAISGWRSAIAPRAWRMPARAWQSTAGRPRNAPRSSFARMSKSSSSASAALRGADRKAVSFSASATIPPRPNRTQGPKPAKRVIIGLVPATDRLAEADPPRPEVCERLGDVGAALGDHAEMPLSFFQGGDGDVQGIFGVYDPHAVGTQEADTISFRDLPETFLQLPPFLSGLLETGADDDRALCAYFCEILEERDDLGRGDDPYCQGRRFWEVKRGGVGSASQDGLFRRMDGVEFPPPAVREGGESLHGSP